MDDYEVRILMSDNYAIKRYHRQTVYTAGMNRTNKILIIVSLLVLAGVTGTAYVVCQPGFFSDPNPKIAAEIAGRINLERLANNLQPVDVESTLSDIATTKSRDVTISRLADTQAADQDPDATIDILIIPKITWPVSGSDFPQQMVDTLENENAAFRKNILNPKYRSLGIGVASDSNNYYIVTKWM
jgi:hypothetical protein